MGSKKRTIGILIVVIVVLLGFAGSLLVFRNNLSSKNEKNNSNNNTAQSLSSAPSGKSIENFYDKPITDEKIALDSIEVNRNKLGYSDKNFTFKYDKASSSKTAYHFDLYYKDIPVYGGGGTLRGVSVMTHLDNSAKILITGVSDSEKITKVNTTPKITEDEASDIIKNKIDEEMDRKPELIIYEINNEYYLSYYLDGSYQTCIINAENGEVIICHSNLIFGSAEYSGQNGDIHQVFYNDYKNEKYDVKNALWDKEKNIFIINNRSDYNYDSYNNNLFKLQDIQSDKNKSAVDGMANTYRAVEYFDKYFDKKFDITYVCVNVDNCKSANGTIVKDNACGRYINNQNKEISCLIFCVSSNAKNPQYSAYLDAVAHEYTHTITGVKAFGTRYSIDSKYYEKNALMEAYSDIFGQLVEQAYTGSTDWKIYNFRNIGKPEIKRYTKRYITKDKQGTEDNDYGEAHNNSTIISHTAYLMSKDNDSKKYDAKFLLDYEQLGQLWYGSLEYLKKTKFMDFADCRWAIEESARDLIKNGVLLENNLKIIEQAFNEVEVSSNPTRRGLTDSMKIIKDKNTIVVPIEDETQSTEPVEITEVSTTPITTTTESITTIPKEANTYNGHSYIVYPESMTWQEAKEYCEKLGGHLVTISNADEQKFVEDLAEKFTDKTSYWLGGYYSDSEWKWVDNTKFSYTNWDSWSDGIEEYRQPDNHTGNEFYLRFANKKMQYSTWYSNKGKWNDVSNEADGSSGDVPLDSFGFICEWDSIAKISEDNNNSPKDVIISQYKNVVKGSNILGINEIGLIDIDFDGELEFAVFSWGKRNPNDANNTYHFDFYDINTKNNTLDLIESSGDNETDSCRLKLYQDNNGNKFYIGYDFVPYLGEFLIKIQYVNGEINTEALAINEVELHYSIKESGKWREATKEEYDTYTSRFTELETNFITESFEKFDNMSDSEKESFLSQIL